MQKPLVILLALYAAIVSTLLLLGLIGPTQWSGPAADADPGIDVAKALRRVTTEASHAAERVYQANVKKQEAQIERSRGILESYRSELGDLDAWIEELSKRNAGGMDKIAKDLATLRPLAKRMQALGARIDELARKVKVVEDRPAVIREVARPGPADPGPKEPAGPKIPTLPDPKAEDPALVAAKIDKATERLKSEKLAELWPAIEVMRKYRVKAAAPRLIEVLKASKHDFAKRAAAVALGEIQWADAVPVLAEALTGDKDLAQPAARAIRNITGFNPELSHSARAKERRRARNAVVAWWRANEEAVRAALGQPKS